MPLSREQNDLLTRVENGAPMGRYLRETSWFPAVLSSALEPDGAPYPVRLLGEDFVAFRATDGRVGFFTEHCPHRAASLLLARNEHNGLRCIFHGWKFRVDGVTVEVPTQTTDHDAFCKRVPLEHYPVREAANIVWVWLGKAEPKPFPDIDFLNLNGENVWPVRTLLPYNWVQSIEGLVDSAHVSVLHQDWLAKTPNNPQLANAAHDAAPVYEFEDRPRGYRYAGIRKAPEGKRYVRISEWTLPWFNFTPGDNQGSAFVSVPIDDTHTASWSIRFDPTNPIQDSVWKPAPDPMNYPPPLPPRAERWGQDRAAMKAGSFSGFRDHFFHEDASVAASQGAIATRAREFLNGGDQAVVRMRSMLLREVAAFEAGRPIAPAQAPAIRVGGGQFVIEPGVDWRTFDFA